VKQELVLVQPQTSVAPCFFSVIIPTYKTSRYICDALDSVFAQTFKDFEVIVINDGTPDTLELERRLEHYMDRIIYLKQENQGPGGARNTGIRRARGEFIALLDSDDQWVPGHLAEMFDVIRENPGLDLIYADAMNFGDSKIAGSTSMESSPSNGIADFESLIESRCTVFASSVVARRNVLVEAGLFDKNFIYGEDYDLWLRVAHRGHRIDYLRKVHSLHRIHSDNLTADVISSYQGQADVLKKLKTQLPVSESLKAKMEREIEACEAFIALERGKKLIIARQYKRAISELKTANNFFHRRKLSLAMLFLRAAPGLSRYVYITHWSKI